MAISLQEVANESGVNRTTVSLILNNHPNANNFASATRKRIRETAARLGYQPNAAARALVLQRTGNIGLVIPDHVEGQWQNPSYAAILNGVNQACLQHDYNVMVFCCNMDNVAKFIFPHGITGGCVDGLLLCGNTKPEVLSQFELLKMPFARIGMTTGEAGNSSSAVFGPDVVQGLIQVIEYLVRHNHTRITMMDTDAPYSIAISQRLNKALAKSHFSVEMQNIFLPNGVCDSSSAKEFMATYFSRAKDQRPTALITSPQACLGVIKELELYNMKCPEDISVVSTYDYDLFDYITPGISSLKFDNETIASYATESLIKKIKDKDKDSVEPIKSKKDFPVSIKIRSSCSQHSESTVIV